MLLRLMHSIYTERQASVAARIEKLNRQQLKRTFVQINNILNDNDFFLFGIEWKHRQYKVRVCILNGANILCVYILSDY